MRLHLRRFLTAALLAGLGLGLHVLARQAGPPDVTSGETTKEVDAGMAHPLDPLDQEEITRAVQIVSDSGKLPEKAFFPLITLYEPPKAEVLGFKVGGKPRRRALVVAFDRPAGKVFEAVVDLQTKKILEWTPRSAQPALLASEILVEVPRLVRADERWRKAMIRRGIEARHFEQIELHPWVAGYIDKPELRNRRLVRVLAYHRGTSRNPYPHVIEGVVVLVDLTAGKVLDVSDRDPIVPIPRDAFDFFDAKTLGKPRSGLKPLHTSMPNGASFTRSGNEIRWQNWRFRFSLHPREGLVLHTVGYEDRGRLRSVLYRASLSEMVVPYGDPGEGWSWRNAFDAGEYGMGYGAISLRPGIEVPRHARLFSTALAYDDGKPVERKDIIALYEQDGGLLWTHTDFVTGMAQTRRGRQLVLHTICTLGNYDYSFQWIFAQDGSLEMRIDMTGILLVKGVASETCPSCRQKPDEGLLRSVGDDRNGVLIARRIVGINHQHFFCFRLDLDVDGPGNSLHEMTVVAEAPTADNPERNAFRLEQRVLRSEREACRPYAEGEHRSWKVVNPDPKRRTKLGHAPAYRLEPAMRATPLPRGDSRVRHRAGFLRHPLWATRYHPEEQYAAGTYINHHPGGDGLPRWVQDNASLVEQDLVLWYTVGVTHVARPEEWPVMPVTRSGFRLVPHGFFEHNPALDVPAER